MTQEEQTLTKADYKLFTGQEATLGTDDWNSVVEVASARLESFLCLTALPTDEEGNLPADFKVLLANFICATFTYQGTGAEKVASKSVRNFTISFTNDTAANAFAQIAAQYGDLIEKYSQCDLGIDVEKSAHYWCGGYYGGCGC